MKKEFTYRELMFETKYYLKEAINENGCDLKEEIIEIFGVFESISLIDILNSNIMLNNQIWFIFNSCGLTLQEKTNLCCLLAEAVIPIYNNAFPDDDRVNNCMKAIKDFDNNLITKEELRKFRNAVYDAYEAVTHAANAVAYAVINAVDAVVSVGDFNAIIKTTANVDSATFAAYRAAHYTYSNISYQDRLVQVMIDFVNNN